MKKSFRSRIARGFTLIEILIVIALIGGITALVVTNLSGIFGNSSAELVGLKVKGFDSALIQYRMNVGSYPGTDEGLRALLVAPDGKADRWKGPYINSEKDLIDTYGKPYGYRYPGTHNVNKYDIWSFGPDQQDGTADDIGNW